MSIEVKMCLQLKFGSHLTVSNVPNQWMLADCSALVVTDLSLKQCRQIIFLLIDQYLEELGINIKIEQVIKKLLKYPLPILGFLY